MGDSGEKQERGREGRIENGGGIEADTHTWQREERKGRERKRR